MRYLAHVLKSTIYTLFHAKYEYTIYCKVPTGVSTSTVLLILKKSFKINLFNIYFFIISYRPLSSESSTLYITSLETPLASSIVFFFKSQIKLITFKVTYSKFYRVYFISDNLCLQNLLNYFWWGLLFPPPTCSSMFFSAK